MGDILVGDKTGEGVFGVGFKIKGPPKKLETSVNPINFNSEIHNKNFRKNKKIKINSILRCLFFPIESLR